MTQAAERLYDEYKGEIPKDECERIVKIVFNADHEPYSTLEERLAKAIETEYSFSIEPPEKGLFLARTVLLRTGIEHVSGEIYQVPEEMGSVLSGPQWALRFNRKMEPHEWDGLSQVVHAEWALNEGKMEVSRIKELLAEHFPDVEIVETIRKETTL